MTSHRPVWSSLALAACLAGAGCRSAEPSAGDAAALGRSVAFLQREVAAWRPANGCYSCHNNGDAARALYTAAGRGYRVPAAALADTARWLRRPAGWDDNQGDPGFSDQRLADLQFALALQTARETGGLADRQPRSGAVQRLLAGQASDGSWPVDPGNAVGSPATYGTVLATHLAARVLAAEGGVAARAAATRARAWLAQQPPRNLVTAAVRLWEAAADRTPAGRDRQAELVAYLRGAMGSEGAWGPYPDAPAEVFDTALVLLALAAVPEQPGVAALVERGRAYLLAQQMADGGWPATTRPSGGESYAQRMSTTGWAVLALLETQRPPERLKVPAR